MSRNTELTILFIYNRIIPKINIAGISAQVDFIRRKDASEYPSGIELAADDGHYYVMLALYNKNDDEIINNYRWEYMDCMTGAIIESELDYHATDDEVLAFFHRVATTNEDVINL